MPFSLVLAHDGIILDACSSIVLHASGRFSEIIAELPGNAFIAEYVLNEELASLDLRLPVAANVVTVINLADDDEAMSALVYGTDPRMDTGESVCASLAKHRNLAVATDDAGAWSFFGERLPHIQLVSSAELVRNWAEQATNTEVQTVIRAIRSNDGYVPHRTHSLREWWLSFL